MTAPMATGGDAVVAALRAAGVTTQFGLPGIQLDGLFNALHGARDWLRVINARHEQGVAYMALGYAAATGQPGVYAVVPGPGFLNTTAALSTAYALHAPVLALIGQITSHGIGGGRGELHELPDQTAILRGLTRWCGLARHPAELAALAATAFAWLAAGRGPAGLELPRDVLEAPWDPSAPAPVGDAPPPPLADPATIRAAAALLSRASAPMIVVGGGAIEAGAELHRLSRLLQAPVVSHLLGRGILDSSDPYALGRAQAVGLWRGTDVILAVGTRFNSPRAVWGLQPGQKVIRIDIDPAHFTRGTPPDVAIAADARPALAALIAELGALPARPSRQAALVRAKETTDAALDRAIAPQLAFLRTLRAALPDESVVVADYTQVGYVAAAAFPVAAPRRVISPGYQGTLGFSFATGLGAKVGRPTWPVVCLTGDGGFLFTANDLATAAQHRIPLITVVFNDGAYGNVRRMQEDLYGGRVIASDLRNPDFVAFAASFGVPATRVDGPEGLGHALGWAMEQDGPVLIEAPVGKMPTPWDLLEPSLPAP